MRGGPVLRTIRIKFARPLHRWCSEGAFCELQKRMTWHRRKACTPLHAAPHHFLQSAGRRPPRFSLASHLDSEPYHQADAIHSQAMRTHHCETHLCNSRSITILPPATENVTRLATNKRFANVQLTTNTTTVPRYLLSCWLKRSAHLFALLSGQKYTESARQTNTSQNTASAVWQNGGPSRQGDYHFLGALRARTDTHT